MVEEIRLSETTQLSGQDLFPDEPDKDDEEEKSSPVSDSNRYTYASKLVGQHRASDIAVTFLSEQMAMMSHENKFAKECRVIRREVVNFQRLTLKAELSLMDYMEEMNCEQLVRTLFDLFDIDCTRSLDASNLAHCLSRLDSNKSFEESMKIAKMSMIAFDADQNGTLDNDEFTEFVTSMSNNMNCSLEDMCKFLLVRTVRNGNGENVLRDIIKYQKFHLNKKVERHLHGYGEGVCRFIEARIAILFKLLDYRGTGLVDIRDVEKSLCQILNELSDKTFRKALFETDHDHEGKRKLDHQGLIDLLFAVVAASSADIDIDDVCNSMTLVLCDPDLLDSSKKLKRRTWTIRRSMVVNEDTANKLQTTPLEKEKINRIFDLWDTDQDGEIGFEELFLAWRKMHGETKEMEQTFDECLEVISKFEFNVHRNQKLDKSEFGTFLAIFSDQLGEDLISMLDYMVVRSALQDNTEEERKFIEKKKSVAQQKLLKKHCSTSTKSLWSNWGVFRRASLGEEPSSQTSEAKEGWGVFRRGSVDDQPSSPNSEAKEGWGVFRRGSVDDQPSSPNSEAKEGWGVFRRGSVDDQPSPQKSEEKEEASEATEEWTDESISLEKSPGDADGHVTPPEGAVSVDTDANDKEKDKNQMIVDFNRQGSSSLDLKENNGEINFLAKIFGSERKLPSNEGGLTSSK